jgi:hypothetical protein
MGERHDEGKILDEAVLEDAATRHNWEITIFLVVIQPLGV